MTKHALEYLDPFGSCQLCYCGQPANTYFFRPILLIILSFLDIYKNLCIQKTKRLILWKGWSNFQGGSSLLIFIFSDKKILGLWYRSWYTAFTTISIKLYNIKGKYLVKIFFVINLTMPNCRSCVMRIYKKHYVFVVNGKIKWFDLVQLQIQSLVLLVSIAIHDMAMQTQISVAPHKLSPSVREKSYLHPRTNAEV